MKTSPLLTEDRITAARRGVFNPVANLTPSVLTSQINNWKTGYLSSLAYTFEAIQERDYQLKADAPKRYKSVARNPYEVVIVSGAQDDPTALRHKAELEFFYNNLTATEALVSNLRGGFPMLVRQMVRAVGDRYSNHEIVYQPENPRWTKSKNGTMPILQSGLTATFTWLPLYFFETTKGRLRFIKDPYGLEGVDMPAGEWLTTVGDGLLLASAICWMFKRLSFNDWVIYNGKFGIPGIHGKTDATKGSQEWDDFVEAVKDFANDWYGVTNRNGEIAILTAGAGGQTLPMQTLIQKMDDAITRMWRGGDTATQTTTDGKVGVSNQSDEKDLLEQDDCEVVTETLNTQVDPYVIQWYEGRSVKPLAYVRIAPPKKKNVDQDIKIDSFLRDSGVPLAIDDTAARYNRTVAEESSPVLTRASAPAFPFTAGNAAPAPSEKLRKNLATIIASLVKAGYQPLADKVETILAVDDDTKMLAALKDLYDHRAEWFGKTKPSKELLTALQNGFGTEVVNGLAAAAQETKP